MEAGCMCSPPPTPPRQCCGAGSPPPSTPTSHPYRSSGLKLSLPDPRRVVAWVECPVFALPLSQGQHVHLFFFQSFQFSMGCTWLGGDPGNPAAARSRPAIPPGSTLPRGTPARPTTRARPALTTSLLPGGDGAEFGAGSSCGRGAAPLPAQSRGRWSPDQRREARKLQPRRPLSEG